LHSALGYRSPEQFEQSITQTQDSLHHSYQICPTWRVHFTSTTRSKAVRLMLSASFWFYQVEMVTLWG